MPSYLSLVSLTDQGIRTVKDGPSRLDAAKEAIAAAGGRLIFFYFLMGEHDIAVLTEFPDDETAARVLLTLGSQGNLRTSTYKAFQESEYRALIASLP
jgi:uncharacterized protein with GYD domain